MRKGQLSMRRLTHFNCHHEEGFSPTIELLLIFLEA